MIALTAYISSLYLTKGFSCDGTSLRVACTPGKHAPAQSSTCFSCGTDNMYSNMSAAPSCTKCEENSFTSGGSSITRTECEPCPEGNACDGSSKRSTCAAGTYSPQGGGFCSPCSHNNLYSSAGTAECKKCGLVVPLFY